MEHLRSSQIAWEPAPDEHFTGDVWFGPLAPPVSETALNTLAVMFTPGARTAWHQHVEGQVLYVTFGSGVVANRAGVRVAVTAGDTVVIPPGEVHWHGAAATSHMVHLSLTTGGPTEWTGQKVTDDEYAG